MHQKRHSYLTKALQANQASNEKPIAHFLLATKASPAQGGIGCSTRVCRKSFNVLGGGHYETLAVGGSASSCRFYFQLLLLSNLHYSQICNRKH
jgi:hypothetical protein